MNSSAFIDWLGRFAKAVGIDDAALVRDQTLLINNIACTFVSPAMGRDEIAIVLLDAGETRGTGDDELFREAMARNLENFLLGAPLFLFNAETRRLVIGQSFEFGETDPSAFKAVLDALALQALAWHRPKE